jgi:hypothetical protein
MGIFVSTAKQGLILLTHFVPKDSIASMTLPIIISSSKTPVMLALISLSEDKQLNLHVSLVLLAITA